MGGKLNYMGSLTLSSFFVFFFEVIMQFSLLPLRKSVIFNHDIYRFSGDRVYFVIPPNFNLGGTQLPLPYPVSYSLVNA